MAWDKSSLWIFIMFQAEYVQFYGNVPKKKRVPKFLGERNEQHPLFHHSF